MYIREDTDEFWKLLENNGFTEKHFEKLPPTEHEDMTLNVADMNKALATFAANLECVGCEQRDKNAERSECNLWWEFKISGRDIVPADWE